MFRFFLLFIFIGVCPDVFANGLAATSPHKSFSASMIDGAVGGTFFLSDSHGNKVQIAKTERWGEIKWSPIETRFLFIDHCDGQASSLYVFEVRYNANKALYLEELYHSPQIGSLGVEWAPVKWNSNGAILRIKRSLVMKLNIESSIPDGETFDIPLD